MMISKFSPQAEFPIILDAPQTVRMVPAKPGLMSGWSDGKMTAPSIKVMASRRLISGESFNTIVSIDKNLYTGWAG
jgi:putative SOS response-associated peptidase YedK